MHQGRAKLAFVPRAGARYRVRVQGQAEPFALPDVHERGVALVHPQEVVVAVGRDQRRVVGPDALAQAQRVEHVLEGQLRARHHPVDQTEAQGCGGIDGVAGEQHLHRDRVRQLAEQ